jgi:hypothetical protein
MGQDADPNKQKFNLIGDLIEFYPGKIDYAVGDSHDPRLKEDLKYLTGGQQYEKYDIASTNDVLIGFIVAKDGHTVAVVTHGDENGVGVIDGNAVRNLTDAQWAEMKDHVSVLYLMSCQFAAGPDGQKNVNRIAELTGATVYASAYKVSNTTTDPRPRTTYPDNSGIPAEKPGFVRMIKSQ